MSWIKFIHRKLTFFVAKIIRAWPHKLHRDIYNLDGWNASDKQTDPLLIIVCTENNYHDALVSALSWLHWCENIRICFYFDGSIPEKFQFLVKKVIKNGKNFYTNNRFGRKLALLLELSTRESYIFSDPDVIVFKRPIEILKNFETGTNSYLNDPYPWIDMPDKLSAFSDTKKIKLFNGFNSGVLTVKKNSLSLNLCKEIINECKDDLKFHFFEQCVMCLLQTNAGAIMLNSNNYFTQDKDALLGKPHPDFNELVLRHYIGTVRHKMYLHGYNYLVKQNWMKSNKY